MSSPETVSSFEDNSFTTSSEELDDGDESFERLHQACLVDTSGLATKKVAPVLEQLSQDCLRLFNNYRHWPEELSDHLVSSRFRVWTVFSPTPLGWHEYKALDRIRRPRCVGFRVSISNACTQVNVKGKRGEAIVWVTTLTSRFEPIMRDRKPTTIDAVQATEKVTRFEWRRKSTRTAWKLVRLQPIAGPGRLYDL